jgi:hypothetical protein
MHLFSSAAEAVLIDKMNESLELLNRQMLKPVGRQIPFLLPVIAKEQTLSRSDKLT